jgi:acylglycerol lipase
LWLASHLAPGATLTGRGLEIQASDNIEMLRGLGADPLVIKGTRIAAIAGLVRLMDRAYAKAPSLPGPLLVLGGARDEIVPPAAHQATLERLTAQDCVQVVYPEGYHMLLRDLQRQVVWDDILAWIDGIEALPSGLAAGCGGEVTQVVASPA